MAIALEIQKPHEASHINTDVVEDHVTNIHLTDYKI